MAGRDRGHMLEVARAIWEVAPEMTPDSVEKMLSYCTDDVVMDWPFGPPEPCHGKQACREFLTANLVEFDEFGIKNLYCDESEETVILTGYSAGRNPKTDRPYANDYVMIFHFRDGLIDRWFEYLNPIAVLEAFGD